MVKEVINVWVMGHFASIELLLLKQPLKSFLALIRRFFPFGLLEERYNGEAILT